MRLPLSLLLLGILQLAQAQTVQPVNLVFEGAGIRGIAYSGAIKALEEQQLIRGVKRFGGTSAGAITALLLSLGYTADDIAGLVNSTAFRKFNDGKFFFFGGIHRFGKYYGWYKGRQFEKWLAKLIEAKTGDANLTFRQFQEKGYPDLYVTGTCLNQQRLIVFSHENYPDMKVKDAVRVSMSIPFYFEAVFLDTTGKIIDHPKRKEGLDIMVDGGFIANFPIRIFDSSKYFDAGKPNEFSINHQTLGFRIDRDQQIESDRSGSGIAPMTVNGINEYFSAVLNFMMEHLNTMEMTSEDWNRSVCIPDGNVHPRIRKLSSTELETLMGNGEKATREFLRR